MTSRISKTIEPFALVHVSLVTGDERGTLLPDMAILVGAHGRIETVAPSADVPVPNEYHVLDGTGKYVMPGLINAHTHLFSQGRPLNPKMATPKGQRITAAIVHSPVGRPYVTATAKSSVRTLLESGVTTIRTLGDIAYEAVALRDGIAAGEEVGPHILASGPLLAIPDGHGAPLIALEGETAQDMRLNTRRNIANGVNAVKIAATGGVTDSQVLGEAGAPQMTVEQMRAICDEAHDAGIIVAAHAQSAEGVRRALTAGVDTIEHGSRLDDALIESFKHNPNALRGYSALIPTISAGFPLHAFDRDVTGITEIQAENSKMVVDGMIAGARAAHDAGVLVGVGTDTAMTFVTQYNSWRELALLVKYAGFTPAEAVQAATRTNARILNVCGTTGSLDEGKYADMVVLDANPLDDLSALAHPELVVAAGHPVWHPAPKRFDDIDRLLDEAMRNEA